MPSVKMESIHPSSTSALHGITVLDFSHVMAGPFATYYLAALGAKVIKIENPIRGDSLRSKPQSFESFNHGKEIRQIDLTTSQGKAQARELLNQADVMVDNMRPGVMEKFGFSSLQVCAAKPRLIHCSISAYGKQGPWSERPAYDHVMQAASGMAMMSGHPEDGPVKVGFPVIDCATGMLGAMAIIAAVRRRDLTGLGESIDTSMFGSALQLMYPMTVAALDSGQAPERKGNVGYTGSPGAETFACRDGWIALGANTPQQMQHLARVLKIENQVIPLLEGQNRGFVSGKHLGVLSELLSSSIKKESALHLEEKLNAVNVPAAMVRDLGQAVQEGIANGTMENWLINSDQPLRVPGLGFRAKTLFAGKSRPFE
jgi:crotonobetainyl-CoA:carnitine CoA-transferase CaiB-like acyl-CoA transferase